MRIDKLFRRPWHYLFRIHPLLAFPRWLYMDIDPRSPWHEPGFVEDIGGFFIPEDPANRRIENLAQWDFVRRDMLILLMRSVIGRGVPGDFAELGVYKGMTARLINHYAPDRILHLFDTFSGFADRDISEERQRGQFSDTSVDTVLRFIDPVVGSVVHTYRGTFPESVPNSLENARFAFVHLDADLFPPTTAGLEFFYPRVSKGGIIVIHDYNAWHGARTAVDQFFATKPELAIPLPDKSGSAVVAKL
jgi:O-methyltransferase